MRGLQAKDLRGNDPEELQRTLAKLQNDLFQHRMKKTTNQLENVMLIRSARRDIAKVMTVLRGQKGQPQPAAPVAVAASAGSAAARVETTAAAEASAVAQAAAKKPKAKAKTKPTTKKET